MNAQAKFFEKLNQRSGRPKTAKPSTPKAKQLGAAVTQQALPGMEDSSKPGRNRRQSGASDGSGEIIEICYQQVLDSFDNQADLERFQRLTGG